MFPDPPQFQFTPLREGRRDPAFGTGGRTYFNSRPCGRGDESLEARYGITIEFQFTPLREGRPKTSGQTAYDLIISIHAPAGGATGIGGRLHCLDVISIHAPAGGATTACLSSSMGGSVNFNSRPCGRGDAYRLNIIKTVYISIHAPAGGATHQRKGGDDQCRLFQFTPLREGRRNFFVRRLRVVSISIHAPAGGATQGQHYD